MNLINSSSSIINERRGDKEPSKSCDDEEEDIFVGINNENPPSNEDELLRSLKLKKKGILGRGLCLVLSIAKVCDMFCFINFFCSNV